MVSAEVPQTAAAAPVFTIPEVVNAAPAASSHTHRIRAFGPPTNGVRVHDRAYSVTDIPPQSPDHRSIPAGYSPIATRSPRGTPRVPLQDTPSTRTGPPRSLSYQFTPSYTPSITQLAQLSAEPESADIYEDADGESPSPTDPHRFTSFRGALELHSPGFEKGMHDRKGKKRERNRTMDDSWKPIRWFQGSTGDEKGKGKEKATSPEDEAQQMDNTPEAVLKRQSLRIRSKEDLGSAVLQRSHTHPTLYESRHSGGSGGWAKLRSLLPSIILPSLSSAAPSHSVVAPEVNITDELITGGLCAMVLGLWFERDDKGHRRIPVLLHRLRIRISDSLHPLHSHKAVFRIECEYANGAIRWVIYRQLRDFISLHTHYAISNAFSTNKDALPEFPLTSLQSYLKFLRRESGASQARYHDFARLQREALENYLLKLIRAVMFHPSANRISGFLEISNLFISLAPSGGLQYKAGFLRLETAGNSVGIGRRSTGRNARKELRWCSVRESYLVIVEDPGETTIWDVFLLDSDFEISQPSSPYRKTFNLLRPDARHTDEHIQDIPNREVSVIHSSKSRLSRVLCLWRSSSDIRNEHPEELNAGSQLPRNRDSTFPGDSVPLSLRSLPPIIDPSTNQDPLALDTDDREQEAQPENERQKRKKRSQDVSHHTFYIQNSQMKLKLTARNQRQMLQWITALNKAKKFSPWVTENRYKSFAPVRMNVATQWLVDARDYMWNLSRALVMARETIYIHDWWLSPELQLRRPNKPKYRLDKLLERKARDGVKIFIILYREVSSKTTPTDSNYTKQKLTSLHENIMIQRSPSHFQTGTFYWAHHEKLCVIDQTIAFTGGIDLCFGRWDTPQHVLVDDSELNPSKDEIWQGKDYSNPRVVDFHALHKPEEDMYDRVKVPRMPWHDVGIQVVGQPARDLARHFVERWNYLLRIKNHTRVMPFLLPPPEFKQSELAAMGLTGTCEMQICRSAGPWSLGTPNRVEHSIQNAYVAAITDSQHFIYIENQFFITSTIVNDVKVENQIGDALVKRIIRAHREKTPWKCCILIPLLPGFPFPVEHSDASAIRIIVDCQNRSLFRGPSSIYGRLRQADIIPSDYISVFSLRNWGKFRNSVLTTEIVYIHGKVCIVDDRLAIIGSANLNERSQRGDRDSEIAAIIRDTDMIDGTMAGRPFKVGRFAHSLRMRLMQEHVGVDVDALSEEDYAPRQPTDSKQEEKRQNSPPELENRIPYVPQNEHETSAQEIDLQGTKQGVADPVGTSKAQVAVSGTPQNTPEAGKSVEALQAGPTALDHEAKNVPKFHTSVVPTSEEKVTTEGRSLTSSVKDLSAKRDPNSKGDDKSTDAHIADAQAYRTPANPSKSASEEEQRGPHDASEEKNTLRGRSTSRRRLTGKLPYKTWALHTPTPFVDPNSFEDPICDGFWKNVWVACAVHNTEIYRQVFHVVPDDTISTWKQYTEFVAHHGRFTKPPKNRHSPVPVSRAPSCTAEEGLPGLLYQAPDKSQTSKESFHGREGNNASDGDLPSNNQDPEKESRRAKSTRNEPFDRREVEEMENLLKETRGHLVIYPARFLEGEDEANNFLFNADRLLPLMIYN